MQRRIVEPANVSGVALAELKSWLGISRPTEDALLTDLLHSGLAMCEAFTGQLPLALLVEERVPATAGRHRLQSRPITSLVSAQVIAQDGSVTTLDPSRFELALDPYGCGTFGLLGDIAGRAVGVTVSAGRGATWEEVPAPLKQGIIRLCAHYYRDRDRTGGDKAMSSPPASVSALWRPFQTMRLA